MSRYIDAEALIKEIEKCSYETWSKGVNPTWWAQAVKVKDNIVKCIERQPTADVVEVVRCKDCKNCLTYEKWNKKKYSGCCRNGEIYEVDSDHYCSYGERREK